VQPSVCQRPDKPALRIAVVTETYPPDINGVARTVGLMVDALLARGHQIELIRPRSGGVTAAGPDSAPASLEQRFTAGFRIPNYPELQLGFTSIAGLVRAWHIRRPDIVHVVTEGPLGWAALLAARRLDIPVVSDFHTNFHDYSRHYGLGWVAGMVTAYLRALHNRGACTFVPTREMQERLRSLGFDALSVVRRGIDTALFHPAKRSAELRRSWQCTDETPVALYVGRLAAEKNLRLFVETVRNTRVQRPELRVVIVGDGPLGARLREQNPDFLFAGVRTGPDLATHYASADHFVFPSLSETFGNVTMEALASGLAVVAYDYAAAREHIVHGHNGLLAPCGDETAFRSHALRLASCPEEAQELRWRARQTAERLSWGGAFDELESALIKIASQPLSGAAAWAPAAANIDEPGLSCH